MLIMQPYALTTARIVYRLPDHPLVLQEYIWQEYDIPPKLPHLRDFLEFWQTRLDGKLYRVEYAWRDVVGTAGYRHVNHVLN